MNCPFSESDCAWIDECLSQTSEEKYNLQNLLNNIFADPAKSSYMQVELKKYLDQGASFFRLVELTIATLVTKGVEIDKQTVENFKPLFSHELLKIKQVPRINTIPIDEPIVGLVQNQADQFFTANIKVHIALLTQYGSDPEDSLFDQLRTFATAYNELRSVRADVRRQVEHTANFEAAVTEVIGRSNVATWSKQDKDELNKEVLA